MPTTEEGFQSFMAAYEKKHGPCPPPVLPVLRDFFQAGFTTAFFRYNAIVNEPGPIGETDEQLFVRTRSEIDVMHGEVVAYAVNKLAELARKRQSAGRN